MSEVTLVHDPMAYPEDELHSILRTVLDDYAAIRRQSPHNNPFMNWFRRLGGTLQKMLPTLKGLVVEPGTGHSSNWSRNLYIQIRRADIAPQRKLGISIAYIFRADLSSVYLSLHLGAESLASDKEVAHNQVALLRKSIQVSEGLQLTQISLGSHSGKSFEDGHIWGTEYTSSALPDEGSLRRDLDHLLTVYRAIDSSSIGLIVPPSRDPASHPIVNTPAIGSDMQYSMDELISDTLWDRDSLEERGGAGLLERKLAGLCDGLSSYAA